ncbi:hypothetical protein [Deinococcus radiodurans]|uniref:hypothetical protein n=1 Tax=Deinococcus radiodurans TaxID=1299 RepID=UPI000AACA3E8|nr:hypothetical protein [Deinococcus radiodurans]
MLADIAECDYRLGRLPEAQLAAEQALNQGAVVPASVVLGNVALDYYHLDDALDHYERVVREAVHGSPTGCWTPDGRRRDGAAGLSRPRRCLRPRAAGAGAHAGK